MGDFMIDSMLRHIGKTVTVFTTSGGLSGSGFTGVLAGVHNGCIRLITDIGAPPACPVGSSCDGCWGDRCEGGRGVCDGFAGRRGWGWNPGWRSGGCGCGHGRGRWGWGGYNWLGSVAEIPCNKIVSFTHNSI
ncbi:MAG: hypothetical protein FWD03_02510 [Defluviitaleaceae bacterium]|nr:hypothetical protein [Defluviitaleaceae bacterium]